VLKQRVRDHIDPKKDLGHSDVGGKKKDAVKTGDVAQVQDVKVHGKVEKAAEDMVRDMELEDMPDKTTAETGGDAKIEDVKVDGKVEKAAESMVKDMELEDMPDQTSVKRNPDGTICEDCN
jgi:hypothetical protein